MGLIDILNSRRKRRPVSTQTLVSRRLGKFVAALIIAGAASVLGYFKNASPKPESFQPSQRPSSLVTSDNLSEVDNSEVLKVLATRKDASFVEIKQATVVKLIVDDTSGIRHQRFSVIVGSNGPRIQVAHNIDLSERVPLQLGDKVDLAGELTFDKHRTPVLHWTHHDPKGKRVAGYVKRYPKRF